MTPDELKKLAIECGLVNGVDVESTFLDWKKEIEAYTAAVEARERERLCTAIKAEDDHCADGDYMMDSDDCISVVKGTWERPDWNGELK